MCSSTTAPDWLIANRMELIVRRDLRTQSQKAA
jgi:hypothetical protein